MRSIDKQVSDAFKSGKELQFGNTTTHITEGGSMVMSLFGNDIAKRYSNGVVAICDGGYGELSRTTARRLNGLMQTLGIDVGVFTRKGQGKVDVGGNVQDLTKYWTEVSNF